MKKILLLLLLLVCDSCSTKNDSTQDSSSTHNENDAIINDKIQNKICIMLVMECGAFSERACINDSIVRFEKNGEWWTNDTVTKPVKWYLDKEEYKRRLTLEEQEYIQKTITKLDGTKYSHPLEVKDDWKYILYVNGKKVASGHSYYLEDFPEYIQKTIKYIKSMAPVEIPLEPYNIN